MGIGVRGNMSMWGCGYHVGREFFFCECTLYIVGAGFCGYHLWKEQVRSGAWCRSMAKTQEVSSSVPSYPAQCTRYRSTLSAQNQQSHLESRILLTSYSMLLSISTGGGGGCAH